MEHRPRHLAKRLRSLRVGWAALILVGAGVVYAVVATITGKLDYGTAGFQAGVVLTGTMLGLALWDLFVAAIARSDAAYLALPERIKFPLPPRAVPFMSPVFFAVGIWIGHQYWH
jgi:hypothetical protein